MREVVAVATDRPSQVAMVTTVLPSSSSSAKLEGWPMNMYSSQSSWIDGGHRLRLRRRWLVPLLPALRPAPALPIRRRGLLRLLLTIAFFWLLRSLLLAELDRGDAAFAAAEAGGRLAVATVTVSSDKHEHASSSLL